MTKEEKIGRVIILIYIALILLISLATISTYVVVRGPDRLPVQGVRFFLTFSFALGFIVEVKPPSGS